MNGKFNAITTFLNTTKIDTTNVQLNGLALTRLALGTANTAVYYDATGNPVATSQLPILNGGTGLSVVAGSQTAGDVVQINPGLTGFTVGPLTAIPASLRILQSINFR